MFLSSIPVESGESRAVGPEDFEAEFMKYDDEVAKVSAIQLARRKEHANDIDALILKYEGSLSQLEKCERELEGLRRDLKTTETSRNGYRSSSESLLAEVTALKKSLAVLRGSRSYRLGRAVSRSWQVLGRRRLAPTGLKSSTTPPTVKVQQRLAAVREIAHSKENHHRFHPGPPPNSDDGKDSTSVESRYNWLLNQFMDSPSKGSAIQVIYFDYFTCGSLTRPADFIQKHAGLLTAASQKEQQVLANIQGQAALLGQAPAVPPRQANIGYLAERGRIMYCAHSSGHYNSNGYSTRTAGLALGLQAVGEDVIVVARPGYPWDSKVDVAARESTRFEQQINGVTHVFNPGPSWTSDQLDQYLAESTDIFVREVQRNRVSLVHSASNYVTAFPALVAARRMGVPFVYEVRGLWEITELSTKPWWGRSDRFALAEKLETLVATNADRVLAITAQVGDELISRGVDPNKITLLPNAVDTDVFSPMPAFLPLREELGLDEGTTIVGYAGSLVAYEGVAGLVSAVGALRSVGRKIALVVVGDGPELASLKTQANLLGITDSVIFTGRVPSTAVPAYMSLFDIMPCPRMKLPVTEMVSPLKPLEAMACGKSMILSDLAPMRDLAGSDSERGLLVRPGDVESLSSAIARLMDDDSLRQSISRKARLWTVGERTWKQAGVVAAAAHRAARETYHSVNPGVPLGELTIAIIADQFTMEALKPEANLVALRPDSWQEQLTSQRIDALFVESAWEGNDEQWHQKVGFYDDEKFDDLKQILNICNEMGVPTIFWNKEDPVHFNRFLRTSQSFDNVFTSDASCIKNYMNNAGSTQRTVSSLPFFAQPKIHNILTSKRIYEHTAVYAGTYYGDRFADRSTELNKLLNAAIDHGLSIYDRQHTKLETLYRFPREMEPYVRGGLDYVDMVEAYKSHPVHINVNSVVDSSTMFSRRVVEIAASGGAIVSGKGRGVEEIFGGLIPVVESGTDAELLIEHWLQDEESRLRDVWLAYRLVHRMHTAAHRLTYVLRTAGLHVQAPEPQKYGIFVDGVTAQIAQELGRQTVPPSVIFSLPSVIFSLAEPESALNEISIILVESREEAMLQARSLGLQWLGLLGTDSIDRTYYEDLLSPGSFGMWGEISSTSDDLSIPGLGMAQLDSSDNRHATLISTDVHAKGSLVLRRPEGTAQPAAASTTPQVAKMKLRILIAGHDLKFADGIIHKLKGEGHKVNVDQWQGHSGHNEELSRTLLDNADVIFCEWTLGNAVWYAENKAAEQRLVTRLHLQELSTSYLGKINYSKVDSIIFVGQHTADIGIRDHQIPVEKSVIIPNYVEADSLNRDKIGDVRFNIGLVGIIPVRKRLDIALDVLKGLRITDDRFNLYIKGKMPQEYSWLTARPDEIKFYENQFSRINNDPILKDAVHFDEHDDDMPEWYRKIGIALSVSDFESFHLTLADGAASGAVAVSLAWPGADQIYPVSWISADVENLVDEILVTTRSEAAWMKRSMEARDYSVRRFDESIILDQIYNEIVGK